MDEPIDAPEAPSDLPQEIIDEIESLSARELRSLVTYVQSRLRHLETPVSELIEPQEREEILRIEERDLYTIVVKRERCEEGCEDCPHEPRVYVVTVEPELDGGRHLHWVDVGRLME